MPEKVDGIATSINEGNLTFIHYRSVEMPEKVDGIATSSGTFSDAYRRLCVEMPEKVDGIAT